MFSNCLCFSAFVCHLPAVTRCQEYNQVNANSRNLDDLPILASVTAALPERLFGFPIGEEGCNT